MKLAVVIPMHNEEAGARQCIAAVTSVIDDLNDTALIVVDDGSSDATGDELEAAKADGFRFERVDAATNQGYGAALQLGARRAAELGAEWVLFMDSDLTNPPNQIPAFVAAMADDVDVIKACRFCRGGGMNGVPFRRQIFSRTGNVLARVLVGGPHRDLTNGFRAIRTDRYLAMPLTEHGFAVIVEEMYHGQGARLRGVDVPSVLTSRTAELRASSFGYTPKTIWTYLRWTLRAARNRLLRLSPKGSSR